MNNSGYVFGQPIGYTFGSVEGHGRLLVPDENAATVKEVLIGFATGRFQTVSEVSRFMKGRKLVKDGRIFQAGKQSAKDMLQRPIYAGYITIPDWNLFLHPGKHEPLIDFATWRRIQDRLAGRAHAPARVDLHEDFPLRNFVTCSCCDNSMTAGWSKGRNKRYAYYFCNTKGCSEHRKSIRKDAIEGAFEAMLRSLQPLPSLFHVAKVMFTDLWEMRLKAVRADKSRTDAEIARIDAKMAKLTDCLLRADSEALVSAYEGQIKRLETDKVAMREAALKNAEPVRPFDELFRTACAFLASPWKLRASERFEHKRMVLKLAFPGTLPYCRKEGF